MSNEKKNLGAVWKLLHRLTLNAKDDDYVWIIPFIKNLCMNTGCEECNMHATQYYNLNPPLDAYKKGGYKALFEWTVEFHNKVNSRIGKQILSIEDAKSLYTQGCTDCTVDKKKPENKNKNEVDFIKSNTKTYYDKPVKIYK